MAAKHVTSIPGLSGRYALSNHLFRTNVFTGTGKKNLLGVLIVEL